jgi:hypothetical protein
MEEKNLSLVEMPITKGIYGHLTNSEYRALEGVSISYLKEIARSPAHFKELVANPITPSPDMKLGTAFHAALLEPDRFKDAYVIAPVIDKRTKVGKQAWEDFVREHSGKEAIDAESYELVLKMADAVHKHPTAKKLLTGGVAEQSVFWRCPVTDVLCKCRPDYLIEKKGIVVDIKTTYDASEFAFKKSIAKYGYHLQTAFYLEGVGINLGRVLSDFVHVVVEKTPPYAVGIYVLDDVSIAEAAKEIKRLLDIYSNCLKTNQWPGYPDTIQNVTIPAYLFKGDE